MNKTAIKNFAVWARQKLIADITFKAGMLGITESGIAEKLPQSTADLHFYDIGTKNYSEVSGIEIRQREALVKAIRAREKSFKSYKETFENIVEEVAYTWFNRLVAIRFMEVNEYLPSGIRVLSSENRAKNEPDFVTAPFDTDLEFTPYEQDRILQLKDENKLDELFRMLFIKQCNKLYDILPELFEKTEDYSELLLTISFTDKDGIIYRLVHDIDEDDFNVAKEGQVEIIGWLYQYYNIEPKAKVFARASGTKIKREEIPAATQLFTPDWIVRYMVENSLGRLWIEGHSNDSLKSEWKYYLDEAQQEDAVLSQLNEIKNEYKRLSPEDIKVIDPCMGSGHILVYAFDVLMQIYESCGYTQRDAVKSILINNIHGLDIDKRAYQLAYFAVMMKARQYNRRIFTQNITPKLCYIRSSERLSETALDKLGDKKDIATVLINENLYAEEYGSVLNISVPYSDLQALSEKIEEISNNEDFDNIIDIVDKEQIVSTLAPIVEQCKLLSQKYMVAITNPPYMPVSNAGEKLSEYVKRNYPDSKTDLFAVFIERCNQMLKQYGYKAMITMHSWMFLSSYEKLREKMLFHDTINMAHLGARAFEEIGGEVVQTTAFVRRNSKVDNYLGKYCRLVEPTTQQGKEELYLSTDHCPLYTRSQDNFSKIPGSPIAYWVSEDILNAYKSGKKLADVAEPKQGLKTGDNEVFLRLWHEISKSKFSAFSGQSVKWFPCNKGGEYRRWYGNNDYVINWENDGYELKNFRHPDGRQKSRPQNLQYMKREGLTYSNISSGNFGIRYSPKNFIFDAAGSMIFTNKSLLYYLLSFLGSNVAQLFTAITSPTLTFEVGQISNIPVLVADNANIDILTKTNINLSKQDWDSFETSWDFEKHPLIRSVALVSEAFNQWKNECEERFNQLKANEEELNRIFIDIYGLQDELTPKVADKDVTVHYVFDCKDDVPKSMKNSNYVRTKRDEIVSLISYAVGCMVGRYSLDTEGLAYAGGEWDATKYSTFIPDNDNCLPITNDDYFEDDIIGRFVKWVETVYGSDTLEENLKFIADALGNKGNTSREVIRNYFLNDFIKDHIKIYQKRPIYWLFDSGKQNGFKALCYMHRWNADTIGNMRVEYLHRMQRVYDNEINRMQEIIDNSHDNKEISNAIKRKEKLQKQLKETKEYDAMVSHLALSRIDIDLDDGVKVNYEKVQTSPDGKKMQILTKI